MQRQKLTYIALFPSDWLSDVQLHQCSPEARGVWIDLLCIMAKSSRCGYLINGDDKPFTIAQLAYIIRMPEKKLRLCIDELEKEGVFSRDENGVIYSRRLVKDMESLFSRRESGRQRAQRFRDRQEASPKHSCASPPSPTANTNPWDYFVQRGYGTAEDWENAGRPQSNYIKAYEQGRLPWPEDTEKFKWKR